MTGKIRHYYSGQITSVVNVDILRYDGRKWASRVTNSDLNFMIRNFWILHLAGVQLASYRGIYTPRYIHGHEHSSTHRDITRRSPIIEITLRWCTRIEPWKLNISVIASQVPMIVKPEIHCLLFFYLLYQHLSLYLPERRSWHKSISTPSQYEGNNYICWIGIGIRTSEKNWIRGKRRCYPKRNKDLQRELDNGALTFYRFISTSNYLSLHFDLMSFSWAMWEVTHNFPIVPSNDVLIFHLSQGPAGALGSTVDFSQRHPFEIILMRRHYLTTVRPWPGNR